MPRRSRLPPRDPFHHPAADEVDYETLLWGLGQAYAAVQGLHKACGIRNPVFRAAEDVMARLEALAILTRATDALSRLHGHAQEATHHKQPHERQTNDDRQS